MGGDTACNPLHHAPFLRRLAPPPTPCLRQGGEEHVVIRHHHLHLRVAALRRQEIPHLGNGEIALVGMRSIMVHIGGPISVWLKGNFSGRKIVHQPAFWYELSP